jgi:hypothetical protein
MSRNIASEILEGLREAVDYLDGKDTRIRVTTIDLPDRVDGRSIGEAFGGLNRDVAE